MNKNNPPTRRRLPPFVGALLWSSPVTVGMLAWATMGLWLPAQPPTPPADDTARVEAMLQSVVNGECRIPAGQYLITRPLKHPGPGVVVRGDGCNNTVLNYRGAGGYLYTFGRWDMDRTDPAKAANWQMIRLSDICLDGQGSSGDAGGVRIWGATRYTIERVLVRNFRGGNGFCFHSSWIGSLTDCYTRDCNYGIKATAPGAAGSQAFNSVTVRGGEHGGGCRIAVLIGEEDQPARTDPLIGSSFTLDATCIEGTRVWGCYFSDGDCINLQNVYFEACCKQPDAGKPTGCVRLGTDGSYPRTVNFTGCRFASTLGPDPRLGACVWDRYTDNAFVRGCRFDPINRGSCGYKYLRNLPYCPIAENSWASSTAGRRVEGPTP